MDRKFRNEKLAELRQLRNVTIEGLAQKTGLSTQTVRELEKPELGRSPRWSTVSVLAKALDVSSTVFYLDNCSFKDCQYDFLGWEKEMIPATLDLSMLAIDLAVGWDNILAGLSLCRSRKIRIRLLAYGGHLDASLSQTTEKCWGTTADAQIDRIQASFQNNQISTEAELTVQIRRYKSRPGPHGMSAVINQADAQTKRQRWWITSCKQEKNTVDQGLDRYEILDSECYELAKDFQEHFEGSWSQSLQQIHLCNQ